MRPSPIKMEATSRRDSMYLGQAGGERMEEEENGVANATFILPKEGSNEIDTKENMR